jgi:pimeloyl-ACP methyl ester carboxylesterase
MQFANLQNPVLSYQTQGAGEPLILIPGFASGAWSWFRQVEDLSKNFQVITFDPRGIGGSKAGERDLQNLSMQSFVADIRQILDQLEIAKAHVLGASFGGFVAQEFALEFPKLVDKLILACTTAGGANHVKPDIEILRSFAPDATLPIGEKIRKFIRPAFTEEFNNKNLDEVEKVCQLREQNEVAETIYLAQLQSAFSLDTEGKLGTIENETLIITGDKDKVVPMQNSVNLAAKIPNAQLKIIENGSHMFFIENAPEFNQTVRDFLRNE